MEKDDIIVFDEKIKRVNLARAQLIKFRLKLAAVT